MSFENCYTLNVVVTDFTGDLDLLLVPVGVWLRENQPDIMTTDEGKKQEVTYIADINNNESLDVSISLRLTERTYDIRQLMGFNNSDERMVENLIIKFIGDE